MTSSRWVDVGCITDKVDHATELIAGTRESSPEARGDCAAGAETGVPDELCFVPSVIINIVRPRDPRTFDFEWFLVYSRIR